MSQVEAEVLFDIRERKPDDEAFIYGTWLRSFKATGIAARRIPERIYYSMHHRVIERILARPSCWGCVVFPDGDPGTILGYIIGESTSSNGTVLHYAYVKSAWRGMGVFRELLKGIDPNGCQFTHWTQICDALTQKWPGATYNPYML